MEILLNQLQRQTSCMLEDEEEMGNSQVSDGFQWLMKMIGIDWYKILKNVRKCCLNVGDVYSLSERAIGSRYSHMIRRTDRFFSYKR